MQYVEMLYFEGVHYVEMLYFEGVHAVRSDAIF